ncbi:cytochrome P450 [Actinacidiphila glaucinigra]|uniref:cytochrome P450 n=1 Tax=Actinacidiphila glaucinigra TaxID=235986 RepID=UPI0033BAAE60
MRGLRPQAVAARIGEIAPGTARFADQWPVGRDVEILPLVRPVLAEIGVRYLFSEDAPALLPLAWHLFVAREVLVRPSRWVLPRWVPTPARRFRTRRQVAFTNALRSIVRRRRSSGRLGDDVLGQMLRPSSRYGLLSEEVILDTLPGITVATFETPSRAAGWSLLHLARYVQAADRVAAEAALLPDDPAATTSTHLDNLQYTQALVREVLRLHPPSWLLSRRAPRQTELADYTIDAGSTVLVCPYTAHRDAREHTEPDRFRPERWLDDSSSSANPGVFLGFGTGPHGCEGAALAMAMLTLMTAQTARRYHLSEPPGTEPGYRVTTFEGLATAGLHLRATLRGCGKSYLRWQAASTGEQRTSIKCEYPPTHTGSPAHGSLTVCRRSNSLCSIPIMTRSWCWPAKKTCSRKRPSSVKPSPRKSASDASLWAKTAARHL